MRLAHRPDVQRFLLAATAIVLVTRPCIAGTLRICREAGVLDAYTGKAVHLPAGSLFADVGPLRGLNGDNYWSVRLETVSPLTIPSGASFGIVSEKIETNLDHHPVGPDQKRLYGQSIPPGADFHVRAQAASPF